MNKNCVYYKGIYLDPNSKGYELYIKKEFKELDALIKLLDAEEVARSKLAQVASNKVLFLNFIMQ